MKPYNVIHLGSVNGFVDCSAPSHLLNQCWFIVNQIFMNKFQWNLNQNANIFIQENTFQNVVCKMFAILYRPQYVGNNVKRRSKLNFLSFAHWYSPSRTGDHLSITCHLTSNGIPMLKIIRSHHSFIFNMGIPIPEKDGLYIEMGPRSLMRKSYSN